jgi:hypothetical protein
MLTPTEKAAGGFETTTATATHHATDFIAAGDCHTNAAGSVGLNPDTAKRFATLKAQFALHGHVLHQSGPGDGPSPVSYMAVKWGMAHCLPTLADAEQFLIQVGGRAQ